MKVGSRSGVVSLACLLLLGCVPPDTTQSARIQALEERVRSLEAQRPPAAESGTLRSYTFEMADDPVYVALADEGELPVLILAPTVTTQGDSQSVSLNFANPNSLGLGSLKFKVRWHTRAANGEAGEREVQWSGQIDPGYRGNVVFAIGPLAAEDLTAITISDVRARWGWRRQR